ncbi:caspase family protein [Corticibacterium sp. UT-5YL-CI-8]|nr:caspase family protein [Tianweitania sp. UT-5YL-CI-8]
MTQGRTMLFGLMAARKALRLGSAMLLMACLVVAVPASAQDKPSLKGVALIVGQSRYEHIPGLPNPANDAREMLKLLTDLGFDARAVSDRDASKLSRDLERFAEDAEGADVALFYYSGHGIEAAGENWLVPVDADVGSLSNANEALVPISAVLDQLKMTVPVTIVLLDACRTNPFPADAVLRKTPTGSGAAVGQEGLTLVRGAKSLNAPEATENLGTVIGFAAEPGRPALDGPAGENSPYASALLRHLGAMNGAEFGAVMRMVTEEVYLDTKAQQRPWVNESLRRLLYFGSAPDEPGGDEGQITGERRQLLLTISELPDISRASIETVAARDSVPLDALYGVLKALGTTKMPEEPAELESLLDAQAERLKKIMSERDALRTDDPEILRLTASADRAIREGAIQTARSFLDQAVGRVEETRGAVDDAEELVKQKRIADAAVYARRAETSALAFDYKAAAEDYLKAFDLIERWDDRLRWNYKNLQAEYLHIHGDETGDQEALDASLKAYEEVLGFIEGDSTQLDRAITRNNMAVVLQTIGERSVDPGQLEQAAAIFRESLAVFAARKDDLNWAAAQNNIGNILLKLGERSNDRSFFEDAVTALRATLEKRPREKVPLDWAGSQNNLGLALYQLSEREGGAARLFEAEAAYRAALEVYDRTKNPLEWAMVQNNLGNTLNAIGTARNDSAKFQEAASAFRSALEINKREQFPISWARNRLNLGNALNNLARFEVGTTELEESVQAYRDALDVFTRNRFPTDWASVQNNLGSVLQTLGQRNRDLTQLNQAASAYRSARRVYTRQRFPLDWAMLHFNLGNTLHISGAVSGEPQRYREAIDAYKDSLREYRRETTPRQWALSQAAIGSSLHWISNSETDTKSLEEAIAARRAALEVLTKDNDPVDWANSQSGLGMSLLNLGSRRQVATYLPEAEKAFAASLEVFTRDQQPLQWAFGQNNIGDLYWNKAALGGEKSDYAKAIEMFELAKAGFTEGGYTAPIPLTDQKISLARDAMNK